MVWNNYALACFKLRYLLFADVTAFRKPNPNLLTGIVIRSPPISEREISFWRKDEAKRFPKSSSPLLQAILTYSFCDALYKYPLQLDQVYHRGIPLLMIFPSSFANRSNSILPRLCSLLQPVMFGLIVPNLSASITRARAHLKPMKRPKQVSGSEIFWMHDHNYF